MKYRAEIDGLRALAVIPVILFHADLKLFNGGFVGVDIFFVISGYLITTILIEDIENNRFSIVNFYERRARRILPALFFVMLACIPFAWMWMLPNQIKDFSQSIIAVSLFASNVLFWRESGYFELDAEEKPLLHTWSLAVEEQYYIIFPIFLFLAWRFGKNRVFWMIFGFAAISFLLSEWGWRNKAIANFYLAPTRAWELFAGSMTAFLVQINGVKKNDTLSLLGLSAIIFSIFTYDETTPFPSVYALVPVLGVVLFLMYADKETIAAKLLSTKAFVGIGLISYSAYLWHQPLFAFTRIYTLNQYDNYITSLLLVSTILLAYLTYRYIEKPFRKKGVVSKSSIFLTSILGMFCFIVGSLMLLSLSEKRYVDNGLSHYVSALSDWNYPAGLNKTSIEGALIHDIDKPVDLLFFGDSHAEQYSILANDFSKLGVNIAFLTSGGCAPIPKVFDDDHRECFDLFDRFKKFLEKYSSVHRIVIAGCFNCYFIEQAEPREFSRSKYDYYFLKGGKRLYFRDGLGVSESIESLINFAKKLNFKYKVVLLGDNPLGAYFDPEVMMQSKLSPSYYFEKKYQDFSLKEFEVPLSVLKVNEQLNKNIPEGVKFVDVLSIVCPRKKCEPLNDVGNPIYRDNNHMRPGYVKRRFDNVSLFLD